MEQRKCIPAFPTAKITVLAEDGQQPESSSLEWPGMTLLDYFAAKLAPEVFRQFQQDGTCKEYSNWREGIAVEAYRIAQEMMEVREHMK